MLTDQEVKHRIQEVITGKRLFHYTENNSNKFFLFVMPTEQDKLHAEIAYQEAFLRGISEGIATRKEMVIMMAEQGLISQRDQEKYNFYIQEIKLQKTIRSRTRSQIQVGEASRKIRIYERLTRQIEDERSAYLMHTADSHADQARTLYLIQKGVCSMDAQPTWGNEEAFMEEPDGILQHDVTMEFLKFNRGFSESVLRYMARHYEWRVLWKSAKNTSNELFPGPITHWNANQVLLVYWSDFYDFVYQHPNKPTDEVIEVDEQLDLWLESELHRKVGEQEGAISSSVDAKSGTKTTKFNVQEGYRVVTREELEREKQAKERLGIDGGKR